MKRHPLFFGILLLALSILSCDYPFPTTEGAEPPAKPAQPKPKPEDFTTLGGLEGKVTRIGQDWFEIGPGWDGTLDVVKKKHNEGNDKPVILFTVGTAVGGNARQQGGDETYLLTELKVGDTVSVFMSGTRAGQQFCDQVIIRRRPGGKIPLLPKDQFGEPASTSARNQAEQDWEEKGIPIPKKYLNKDGRYPHTDPPYPAIAPPPHEAKPKPPAKP